eukprot:CAMPEP_0171104674 /NCGR_PEP_ID=MMETSP0766_2-20121228/61136_1 /TAXON_ID=439317 /ORGANISM="Gambierdiscus australes, Strain CAWD 149" /LENGTH=202 /DNA_ID=CAMNT_0011565339 /DNA_START=149 /DNA_END=758 /DNA_ORIENTATION=+
MARTIEITDGVYSTTTRNWLKKEMEQFGEVDVCHMGNRDNPQEEPPWVRFCDPRSAEKAMAAIQAGQVFLDGLMIKAELRSAIKRPPPPVRREREQRRDLDFSSRDFYMEQGVRDRDEMGEIGTAEMGEMGEMGGESEGAGATAAVTVAAGRGAEAGTRVGVAATTVTAAAAAAAERTSLLQGSCLLAMPHLGGAWATGLQL